MIATDTPINAIEFQGNLVVAEIASGSVAQFNGDERTVLASGLFVPAGLAASADALYVSDWASGLIFQLAAAGEPLNPPRIVTAGLKNPEAMALDANGNLLVVETGSRSLVRVNTTTGQIATVAAGLDLGPPLPAPGFPPTYMFDGVAVASSGAIYVTGYGANVIYRITEQSIGAPAQWTRIPTDPATTPGRSPEANRVTKSEAGNGARVSGPCSRRTATATPRRGPLADPPGALPASTAPTDDRSGDPAAGSRRSGGASGPNYRTAQSASADISHSFS